MGCPAFEKRFAICCPRHRAEGEPCQAVVDLAPATGTEFAQRIILCADPLEIEKERTFARARVLVARRHTVAFAAFSQKPDETFADAFRGKNQIRRQNCARRGEKRGARSVELSFERLLQLCFGSSRVFAPNEQLAGGTACFRSGESFEMIKRDAGQPDQINWSDLIRRRHAPNKTKRANTDK